MADFVGKAVEVVPVEEDAEGRLAQPLGAVVWRVIVLRVLGLGRPVKVGCQVVQLGERRSSCATSEGANLADLAAFLSPPEAEPPLVGKDGI